MASVESMSQLERMGSKLRYAIWSCILESLRTNSFCPVCKTHSSRREARPAPRMDSLVEIFRASLYTSENTKEHTRLPKAYCRSLVPTEFLTHLSLRRDSHVLVLDQPFMD
ncbi:hypothetical protein R1flu_016068 [Riccia fluitans]|uniref:Uncharacterized protein n=1 Tax=Riccia fluitans TaxID=41844 RepID=A0ABD1YKS9_9MARC